MKHLDKLFVVIASILVITVFVYGPWEKSYVGVILEPFLGPDWENIHPVHIVKSSTVITMVEKNGNDCLVKGAKIFDIMNNPYFVKSEEFAKKINYNNSSNIIILPCNEIQEDKSILHVWSVVEEAGKDAGKYKYFITAVEETGIEKES